MSNDENTPDTASEQADLTVEDGLADSTGARDRAASGRSSAPPQYGVGPFSVREVVLLGVWLVAFIVSFFPLYAIDDVGGNVWGSGIDWVLAIFVPTVAVFLIVLRRLSPGAIRRVGSLGIDQFASVAFSVAAVVWLATLWGSFIGFAGTGLFFLSWVAWVETVLMLGGVVLTVCAPWLPTLSDDFAHRPDEGAHRVARGVRPVVARPPQERPAPAAAAPAPGAAADGYGQAPYGQAPYGQAPYGQARYGQVPYGAASYGDVPAAAPGYAAEAPHAPSEASHGHPENETAAFDGVRDDAETAPSGVDDVAVVERYDEADAETADDITAIFADDPDDRDGEGVDPVDERVAVGDEALAVDEVLEPRVDEPVIGTEPVSGDRMVDIVDADPAVDAAAVDTDDAAAPAPQAFWALAPEERPVLDDAGTPIFTIGPTAWALVIEDRGEVYVLRHEDGRIGYLHDVSDVVRG